MVGIEDRKAGVDLVSGLAYPAPLFEIHTAAGCASTSLTNLSDASFSWTGSATPGGARIELTWIDLGGLDLDVTVTVELSESSPRASWHIAAKNQETDLALRSVTFPFVSMPAAIGARGDDDALVLALDDGVLVHAPGATLSPGEGLVATYPADLSLQLGAFYDAVTGLYAAARDTAGDTKTMGFTRVAIEGAPALVLQLITAVPEVAGGDFEPGWDVELGPFSGDWFDAAATYRAWAETEGTLPSQLSRRTDLPPAVAVPRAVITSPAYADDGTAWLPATAWPTRAASFSALLSSGVSLLTFGWERWGAWTGPNFFPPRDGDASFQRATTALRQGGDGAFVYLSGTVWRLARAGLVGYDDRAHFEAVGRNPAAKTCDGNPMHDAFYESIGWPSVRMCPGASAWRATVASAVAEAARLGTDLVSVDEFPIGSVYPCFDETHGHPPGQGRWQGQAYRAMLAAAREQGRAALPSMAIAAEEPNELYADILDAYVSRDNLPEGLYAGLVRAWGEQVETVPLFATVYHDRLPAIAEAPAIYDAYGQGSRLREWSAVGLARTFVLGKIPAAATVDVTANDPVLLDMYRRVVAATVGDLRPWLLEGRLLRPPVLDVAAITYAWPDTDLVTGAVTLRERTTPSVLAGRFEAPDGSLATVVSNVAEEVQAVTVPLHIGTLSSPFLVSCWNDEGLEVVYEGADPPALVEIELPARGLGAVIVAHVGPRPPRRHLPGSR